MTSRSVPWRSGSSDAERGNSSYQAQKRAAAGRRRREGAGSCLVAAVRCRVHRGRQLLADGDVARRVQCLRVAELLRVCLQVRPGVTVGARRGCRHEVRADDQLLAHVLAGVEPLAHIALPGREAVGPGHDRERVAADDLQLDLRAPAVVAQRVHRDERRRGGAWRQVLHADQHDVVAVDERVGLDDQPVTDDAFDREAAAVDDRGHVLDRRARTPVTGRLSRRGGARLGRRPGSTCGQVTNLGRCRSGCQSIRPNESRGTASQTAGHAGAPR